MWMTIAGILFQLTGFGYGDVSAVVSEPKVLTATTDDFSVVHQ
ncbi:MAG: hypothetical protein HLUCCO02_05395 [Idiomarinaceae bacterium HL-53]|nr:MAG: hypothetical protein HLUCCO02_05395 [Idiomarinaceae bacterium HL-53]CUS47993.1 hypothetical protein Ga0003345_0932 [Idiomarinaceae bacterium HL-53]